MNHEDILDERLKELEARLINHLVPKEPQKKSQDEIIRESFEKVFKK